ncbi:MAG: RNA polymerase sigma factor [Hyphomicrobiales bacterium]
MVSEVDFATIFDEFYERVIRYVTRIVGQNDSEDVAQEVFEKISKGIGNFRGESRLSTWIYRIATHTALDKLRAQASKQLAKHGGLVEAVDVEAGNQGTSPSVSHPEQNLIQREMNECVREYVDNLAPGYRTALILSEMEGFKNQEIADILQISLDSVKIRLHRARAKLKRELETGCTFYHNDQGCLACDRKAVVNNTGRIRT